MAKKIVMRNEAKKKLISGVNIVSDAVKTTLGPSGKSVLISNGRMNISHITKDGVTVARSILLDDLIENEGAKFIIMVANKTDEVGDGTTTATILAQSMLNDGLTGMKDNVNFISVKRGIDIALNKTLQELDIMSKELKTNDEIVSIGTISANGDENIGKLIGNAMEMVGRDGLISIEEGKTYNDRLNVKMGMQFDKGMENIYYSNTELNETVLENPYILLYNRPISQIADIQNILSDVIGKNRPILIISDGVNGEAMDTLILNKKRNKLSVCSVIAPSFGESRQGYMEDIGFLTGANYLNEIGIGIKEITLDHLGSCDKIIVTAESTTIINGHGDKEQREERVQHLNNLIEHGTVPEVIEELKIRKAKLEGGVAVISIGAISELEMKEKKDRAVDALNATKGAVKYGILPGGGMALMRVASNIWDYFDDSDINDDVLYGIKIVLKALRKPFHQILTNIGFDDQKEMDILMDQVLNTKNGGFDGVNMKVVDDMVESGIIDPTIVTKTAISNACSVVSTVLTTDAVIVEDMKGVDMTIPNTFG